MITNRLQFRFSPMRYCLFFAISVLGLESSAQIGIYNRSLTDSTLTILYAGVDNHIEISPGHQAYDAVSISNASLKKIRPNVYTVNTATIIPPAPNDSAILICRLNGEIVEVRKFSLKYLGKPAAKLGNISPIGLTSATVEEILANTKISVELLNCYYKHDLIPKSFRFRIVNDKTNFHYHNFNQKAELYSEQIELLKQCIPGTEIILDWMVTSSDKKYPLSGAASTFIILK